MKQFTVVSVISFALYHLYLFAYMILSVTDLILDQCDWKTEMSKTLNKNITYQILRQSVQAFFSLTSCTCSYHTHTHTHTHTHGRTPLDEWSACRTDLYLKKNSTHNRQTSMPPTRFETVIPASERLQVYDFDRAATGISCSTAQIFVLRQRRTDIITYKTIDVVFKHCPITPLFEVTQLQTFPD